MIALTRRRALDYDDGRARAPDVDVPVVVQQLLLRQRCTQGRALLIFTCARARAVFYFGALEHNGLALAQISKLCVCVVNAHRDASN